MAWVVVKSPQSFTEVQGCSEHRVVIDIAVSGFKLVRNSNSNLLI